MLLEAKLKGIGSLKGQLRMKLKIFNTKNHVAEVLKSDDPIEIFQWWNWRNLQKVSSIKGLIKKKKKSKD